MAESRTRVRALRGAGRPVALLGLDDPPDVLHVLGAWPDAPMVAIVGSRAATVYGRAIARRLAADLVGLGWVIVSGLARGIDAAAHEGALEAGGVTVAVLPGSLDTITPPSHTELARRIAAGGALVAEWASGMPAMPGLFLRRNRLIAGLAAATVVVEAAERSGALSTAAIARRLGRPLLAVPGDVDRPSSRGANALLRSGALVCENAGDVCRAVALAAPREGDATARPASVGSGRRAHGRAAAGPGEARATAIEPPASASDSARLAAVLDHEPRALEALARRGGLAPERALAALLELEWAGLATPLPGPRWVSSPNTGGS